ncbi:hypothetical protein NW759_008106 [Fusarium solani]|nr:hypothetical protein NW759_008106 [Fusarium solani]
MTFSFDPTAEDFRPVGNQAETLEIPDPEHASMYDDAEISEVERGGQYAITAYLKENVQEFRHLQQMRTKGWESSKGDAHFNKQRRVADEPTEKDARFFYNMMHRIGRDINKATRAFDLSGIKKPALLDMCMAPGAFLAQVLDKYPNTQVKAMSLPLKDGGHRVRLGHHNVAVEFRDITMLAADMGMQVEDVPATGPDPGNLEFTKVFSDSERFDLVLSDGAVRRTHQRPAWREHREATRLTLTQLAIGLQHLNNGGTMVILLHKLDSWPCFSLIRNFSKFSTVQLFKHPQHHRLRSSFYLVAKNIQADSTSAKALVLEWKEKYNAATVGTDEEYSSVLRVSSQDAQAALDEFGEEFTAMGRKIWKLQAESLAKASFMKSKDESQGKGNESENIGQQDVF